MRIGICLLAHLLSIGLVFGQQVVTEKIRDHHIEGVIQGDEKPVVLIEAGLGQHGKHWRHIQNEVADFATVLTYSRAGYGNSGATTTPRTPVNIASELRVFVDSLRIDPPFILVGHSMGGTVMRVFATQYPHEVAGLVLVDGSHERQYIELSSLSPTFWVDTWKNLSEWADSVGGGTYSEMEEFWRIYRKGVLPEAWPLPNVPIIVLTQVRVDNSWTGATFEGVKVWRDLHTEFFKQSTNARHIVVDHVGHNIHKDDPALVVEAIRELIEMVKDTTK